MSSKSTFLLIGGTGKVGSVIAKLLQENGHHAILASRKGTAPSGFIGCHFDWLDNTTFNAPFEKAQDITSVFLTAPGTWDLFPPMKAFIDFARTKGVKRFVLLSASVLEAGGPAMGLVHQYLIDLKVEYAVLRPTWFMENFSAEMKEVRIDLLKNEIYSATGVGKIPWISVKDIGTVGYRTLTDRESHDTDYVLVGPELLSYDDIAQILTEVIGKTIVHVNLTEQQLASRLTSVGMSEVRATTLAKLEEGVRQGGEEKLNDVVLDVTGQPPTTFREYAEASKSYWIP